MFIQSIIVGTNSGDCMFGEENEDLGRGSKLHETFVSGVDCDNNGGADDEAEGSTSNKSRSNKKRTMNKKGKMNSMIQTGMKLMRKTWTKSKKNQRDQHSGEMSSMCADKNGYLVIISFTKLISAVLLYLLNGWNKAHPTWTNRTLLCITQC